MTATSNRQPATSESGQEVKGYRRLMVWQKADELAYRVYEVTEAFPDQERFGLVSQMRRASISIPANIVEGYAYETGRQRRRFYGVARASLAELEYYLDFAHARLQYINAENFSALRDLRSEVGRLLNGFIRSVR